MFANTLIEPVVSSQVKNLLPNQNELNLMSNFFNSFADPTRLKILSALSLGSLSVGQLSETIEINQTTVSHQLKTMRERGLIQFSRFGKILRSTSLDELPELFNILKGDMSLIGPRPLAVSYLPYYNEKEKHRHDVRPGLTGLAQINGRNALNWEERFKYDIEYVNNITFMNDIKIFFKTFIKVLKKEDVVVRGTGNTIDFDEYRRLQNGENKK